MSWPRPPTDRSPRRRAGARTAELLRGRRPRTPGPPSGSREKWRGNWSPAGRTPPVAATPAAAAPEPART